MAIKLFAENAELRRRDNVVDISTDNPFEKVLDRLREKGWCKESPGDEDGPNCINGAACYEAVFSNQWRDAVCAVAVEQFPDRVGGYVVLHGMNFNNHPDTTFADVERVLEKAAVKWEEERVLRDE